MKKIILLIVAIFMVTVTLSAQNIFFSTKEGQKLIYATMDDKGKVNGYSQQTISKVTGSGKNFSISYIHQMLDNNQKTINQTPEATYTINVVDNVMEMDMKSFSAPGTEGMAVVTGDKIRIPSSLKPGDKLEDVKMAITINMGIKIVTDIIIKQRECLAIEEITVPAGKYKCHKLTETSSTTVMKGTTTMKILTWYAPNVGMIKNETYDSNGKLVSSNVLHSIK